jgi:class 3 adenylate cyclase
VNLASRLEGVSGRSRIIIGEGTFRELETLAPEVAALCRPLEPVTVKGFRQAVKVYEVAWQQGLA